MVGFVLLEFAFLNIVNLILNFSKYVFKIVMKFFDG